MGDGSLLVHASRRFPIQAMANLIPCANATESIASVIPYKEEFFKLAEAEIRVPKWQKFKGPRNL